MIDMIFKMMGVEPAEVKEQAKLAYEKFGSMCEQLNRIENKLDKILGEDYDKNPNQLLQKEKDHAGTTIHDAAVDTIGYNPGAAGDSRSAGNGG